SCPLSKTYRNGWNGFINRIKAMQTSRDMLSFTSSNTHHPHYKESEGSMAQYFTREEAEALLPQITVVLLQIQEHRQAMQQSEEELGALHAQAMGNGHHLHGRITKVQKELAQHLQTLQALV